MSYGIEDYDILKRVEDITESTLDSTNVIKTSVKEAAATLNVADKKIRSIDDGVQNIKNVLQSQSVGIGQLISLTAANALMAYSDRNGITLEQREELFAAAGKLINNATSYELPLLDENSKTSGK